MIYIEGKSDFQLNNTAVTLGKFDGIHRGHQLLLDSLGERKDYNRVMFTFNYHPGNLFSDKGMELIFTERERMNYLEEIGCLDGLVSYPFDMATASMSAESFVEEIIAGKLDARRVVVGTDFRFGKGRAGDVKLLDRLSGSYGYELIVCDKVRQDDEVISSTLIRNEIEKGRMERVQLLLGRPYSIRGTVIRGKQIGRTIGFPTANIIPPSTKLLPPDGVYFGQLRLIESNTLFKCLCNIGTNPTVNTTEAGLAVKTVETHILDDMLDLYGKEIEVRFLHFARAEKKFGSLEALKEQIERDRQNAAEWMI